MTAFVNREVIDNYAVLGSERSILNELYGYFSEMVPERIEAARTAMRLNDTKQLQQQLHALKNSFLNVGALGVAEECQDIENNIGTLDKEQISSRLDGLFDRFNDVKFEVQQILAEASPEG
jgi:HPt (histidine-containing phosphotransfer) domain-containing protein